MELRDGMLGVVIIAVALSVALFGSYLAGVTSYETEVINYKWLADVSGEFDYDQSPQYIDFDPSSNYTGYYSTESKKPYEEGYYFAEGQVDYTPYTDTYGNVIANNYKLDLAPEEYEMGTVDVSDCDVTWRTGDWDPPYSIYYNYNSADNENVEKVAYLDSFYSTDGHMGVTSLADFLNYMGLHKSGVYILKASGTPSNGNSREDETFDSNWILFTNKDMWEKSSTFYGGQYIYRCANNAYNEHNNTNYSLPPIACKAEVVVTEIKEGDNVVGYNYSGMAYFYSDVNLDGFLGYITLESCLVCYGTGSSNQDNKMNLAESCDYIFQVPRTSYLNPNYGVSLKDGE